MSNTKPSLGHLHARASRFLEASSAYNSNKTYENALATFDKFRNLYQMPLVWPASKDQVILFIAYCFECGYAPSSIATYIGGISFKHKLHAWYEPLQVFVIKKLVEGCKRSETRRDTRSPVTPNMLKAICSKLPILCYSHYESLLFKGAYLLAYYGLLRVSEIVFTSTFQTSHPLQLSDLSFLSNSLMTVTIRVSKTCQRGQPVHLKIPCIPNSEFCPVCVMREYSTVRSKSLGQLFIHANGRPLTRSQFAGVLAKAVQSTIYRSEHIRTHSFRIGRASELASLGVNFDVIKELGRWRSDAYKTYIRL